ncbi:MAG: hypothetical protein AAGC64_10835 [Bacteroidota bacterium]
MKIQILKAGFFLLLFLNVVLSILLFRERPSPHRMVDMRGKISESLRLNQEQNDQFMDLAYEHRQKINALHKKQQALIIELFEGVIREGESVPQREKLMNEIKILHGEKVSVTYNHFKDIQALCSDDQLPAFQEIFVQLIPLLTGDHAGQRPPVPDA